MKSIDGELVTVACASDCAVFWHANQQLTAYELSSAGHRFVSPVVGPHKLVTIALPEWARPRKPVVEEAVVTNGDAAAEPVNGSADVDVAEAAEVCLFSHLRRERHIICYPYVCVRERDI